jgi:preprotein translocase subunit SecF
VINKSINETLGRTLITALLMFFASIVLLIFGGPVIRDFAFAMTVGTIAGTYSTMYVASPIVVGWYRWRSADGKRGAPKAGGKKQADRAAV